MIIRGIIIWVFRCHCENNVNNSALLVPIKKKKKQLWKEWIIKINCKVHGHYGKLRHKHSPKAKNTQQKFPSSTSFKSEAFMIPSTVMINNVSSSYPKSTLMYLPCENNARIEVSLDSIVLWSASFKATKLLVERAGRKSGKSG